LLIEFGFLPLDGNRLILAIHTTALVGANQFISKAFAVLSDALIVLTSTSQTNLLDTDTKGVGTFLQGALDCKLAVAASVGIRTTNAAANTFFAYLPVLKTGAVELEAA
jgi:hypothetical protein